MQGKRVLIAVAAVLAVVAAGALSLLHRHRPESSPARAAAAVIPASQVTLSGKIRPQHVTTVAATVAGNIDAFLVEVGQDVYEGQVLARIGATGLESAREAATAAAERAQEQVNKAEAAVTNATLEASRADADAQRGRMSFDRIEKAYSRQKTLHAAGATSRQAFEKTEQDYQRAQTEFALVENAARAAREQTTAFNEQLTAARRVAADKNRQLLDAQDAAQAAEVTAPVDGIVVARSGEVGKSTQEAGNNLFQIATDIYALEVAVEPPPATLKNVQVGQAALVLIPELQSAGIEGRVKQIEGNHVVVEFTSNLPAIRPGMQADVRLKW